MPSPGTSERIVKLGYAFRESKALLSAVELGVFTALATAPLDLHTLRNSIGIDQRGARDFFDALVALGLLERNDAGLYSNTPETALYLDRRNPTYIGGELAFLSAELFGCWNSLTAALRTGKPQSGAGAAGMYPARYADQAALEIFAGAMTAGSLAAAKALAVEFPWQEYKTIVDVGAAEGCLPVQIALAHSHVTGGGFDLPPLRPLFDNYVRGHSLSDRLQFYPGSFFHDPLPDADVLVMGRVLHNWDLATKKMLLNKAYEALSEGGALIICERLIDDERRLNAAGLLASLNMLIMTEGGFDFAGLDCISWMKESGFRNMRVAPLAGDQSMIVGYRC
jgi:hypothetical protein